MDSCSLLANIILALLMLTGCEGSNEGSCTNSKDASDSDVVVALQSLSVVLSVERKAQAKRIVAAGDTSAVVESDAKKSVALLTNMQQMAARVPEGPTEDRLHFSILEDTLQGRNFFRHPVAHTIIYMMAVPSAIVFVGFCSIALVRLVAPTQADMQEKERAEQPRECHETAVESTFDSRSDRDVVEDVAADKLERSAPVPGPATQNDSAVRSKVLLSHAITRLGTQGWTFIAPLVLVRFTPDSILGPAIWGMATMLATAFLGPCLGDWADRTGRDFVITCGVLLQLTAVAGATFVIIVALSRPHSADEKGWTSLWLYTGFGMLEKFGTLLSDVSVKREWVPQLFTGDDARSMNSKMSQIDLSTEIVGPFFAGLLITVGTFISDFLPSFLDPTDFGFVAVGVLNVLSFWPQLCLLRSVYSSHGEFLQPVPPEKLQERKGLLPQQGAWGTWCRHPGGLQFLSMSYALLYLSVLSPHGALFTAFLQLQQVPSWLLSQVRGAGALLGIVGIIYGPALGQTLGNRGADALSVCWLAAWMVVALLAFNAASGLPLGITKPLLVFMAAVCMGRPGLYAFEVGVLNKEQELVDQRCRSAVGTVDAALTSIGTLVMYGAGIIFSRSSQFGLLVNFSACFVTSGAVTYIAWTALYKSVKHRHVDKQSHGHSHDHGHSHSHLDLDHTHHEHTMQMEEIREAHEDGSYMHEHIIYQPGGCIAQ